MMRELSFRATVLSAFWLCTLNVTTASSGFVLIVADDETVMVWGLAFVEAASCPDAPVTSTTTSVAAMTATITAPPLQARLLMDSSSRKGSWVHAAACGSVTRRRPRKFDDVRASRDADPRCHARWTARVR